MEKEPKGFVRRFLNTEILPEENEKLFSAARAKRGARIGAAAGLTLFSAVGSGTLAYVAVKLGGEITLNDIKETVELVVPFVGICTSGTTALGAALDVFRPISKGLRYEEFEKRQSRIIINFGRDIKSAANKIRSLTTK